MIDKIVISVRAGNGGSGAIAFEKKKGKPYGPPRGGDGGKGGSIFIQPTRELYDLEHLRFGQLVTATDGKNGAENRKKGKEGEDVILKVPFGTMVKVKRASMRGETTMVSEFEYDLTSDTQLELLAKGGKGGAGNKNFSNKRVGKLHGEKRFNTFRKSEKGGIGELSEVSLELKLIADIGLIGLPNVGKSSLLAALTQAKPRIADYEFTTLEPNLGVLEAADLKVVLADIPGLIEGASTGKGLGDRFLRHIERVRGLVHVLAFNTKDWEILNSASSEKEGGNALALKLWEDYKTVRGELADYTGTENIEDIAIDKKPEIVVLNKTDLVSQGVLGAISSFFEKKKIELLFVSAVTKEGLGGLKSEIAEVMKKEG